MDLGVETGMPNATPQPAILTIGHSTLAAQSFVDLARGAGVDRVIDVRIAPGSRRHPHFARAALERWLPEAGIGYEWWGEPLGGRRKPVPGSPHVALRDEGFRGFADHMDGGTFREALGRLTAQARRGRLALLCAEALWWRCHRSMIADALVVRGVPVLHVMPDGTLARHALRAFARAFEGGVRYDVVPER